MSFRFDCLDERERERGISRAAVSVSEGLLVVLPTDSAYGVGTDAFSHAGIALMAQARGRRQAPPVLVAHGRTLDGLATGFNSGVRDLADAFWPGGLTLLCTHQPTLTWDLGDGSGTVALRMPMHPVALRLLEKTGPMAVTSANRPGTEHAAVPLTYEDAWAALVTTVDVYLDAGPMTRTALSTVVDGTDSSRPPRVLRVGAIGLDALRAVVPDLDTSAVEPAPDRDADPGTEPDAEPDAEPAGTDSEAAR
ncbi:L-threonylcarbamoyladenylate synthase [Kineosporia sp. A_224]|uniref:L-threonylcarbamoyladenylate synthase n=1 Tax=Kineosporia sp. A_224 TaxID=1962180 RepID=UPI000B4C0B33|nr:L-threonylcarbamoyladenylate synthase [Kineosporia sp. A_224]